MGTLALAALLTLHRLMPSSAGKVLLLPSDAAVLATAERRQDLPCQVTPVRPALGFDLALYAGFTVRIPSEEPSEGHLRLLARITPLANPDDPVYLTARFEIPPATEDVVLHGRFSVSEGRYRVDWLLRDRSERVCSQHWELTAERPGNVDLAAPLDEDAPVVRDASLATLHVRVVLHLAPQHPGAATLDPGEIDDLLGMLRAITREPRVGRWSLAAFQPAQQRIVFRQDDTPRLDFAGLREALAGVDFLRVDYRQLLAKGDPLAGLLAEGPYDAVVVLGSTLVYYPGGKAYNVSRPSDFAAAWRDMRRRLPTPPTGSAGRGFAK